jgi:hypothetical protein
MAVGVGVGVEASLQHFVRAGLNARHHVGRGEGNLLNFSKVVFGVAVKSDAADWDQRELFVRPHLRERHMINSTEYK